MLKTNCLHLELISKRRFEDHLSPVVRSSTAPQTCLGRYVNAVQINMEIKQQIILIQTKQCFIPLDMIGDVCLGWILFLPYRPVRSLLWWCYALNGPPPLPQTPQSLVLSCSFLLRVRRVTRTATARWNSSCQTFLRPNRKQLQTTTTLSSTRDLTLFREEWNRYR